ncbi:MAG: hypothetical protein R3332_04800 [Pseudohongiellaceae bacterium]|nr:hypothetical protein [Pseudohongiellaceae bacterium]
MMEKMIVDFPSLELGEPVEYSMAGEGPSGASVMFVQTEQGHFVMRRYNGCPQE